jgi:hypothetical protein
MHLRKCHSLVGATLLRADRRAATGHPGIGTLHLPTDVYLVNWKPTDFYYSWCF